MPDVHFERGSAPTINRQKDGPWKPSVNSGDKKPPKREMRASSDTSQTSGVLDDVTFVRLPEVKAITGLSKTSIYELIRANSFPPPVRIGSRSVAWIKLEIREWALDRVRQSRIVA